MTEQNEQIERLKAYHEMGKTMHESLDLDQILDTIVEQVIARHIFRSLMIAVVEEDEHRVRVARSLTPEQMTSGQWSPRRQGEQNEGVEYDLDDESITAQVARTGEMAVIDGWDERCDQSLAKGAVLEQFAHCFIPVVYNGRVMAVIATGSQPEQKPELLHSIEAMQPLLDAAASAIHHARLHRQVQARERDRRQSQRMEAMGELTAGIAHHFNNLLQGMFGHLELARVDADDRCRALLDAALRIAEHQAELVEQLVAYSRSGPGPDRGGLDLASLFDELASICRQTFDRRIELHVDVEDGLPQAWANHAQIEQALLNLSLNARDAVSKMTGRKPQVLLQARRGASERRSHRRDSGGQFVCLVVKDNGVGMKQSVLERAFDPFFTTKDVGEGTGLGLSTAQGIVRHHGGWIECDTTEAVGTEFRIYLPEAEEATGEAEPAQTSTAGLEGDETILLIDDEDIVRRVVANALESMGYTVLVAADGAEGLELWEREPERIALTLLDLSMPGMSGEDVLERMDPARSGAKVVLFTGYDVEARLESLVCGALLKPVRVRELLSSVRAALDGNRAGALSSGP